MNRIVSLSAIIHAIYECGPYPTAIAKKMSASVGDVRRWMAESPEAVATYMAQLESWRKAIDACNGDVAAIAKYQGVPLSHTRAIIMENPPLRDAVELLAYDIASSAVEHLRMAVNRGERWAIELSLLNSHAGASMGFGKNIKVSIEAEAAAIGQDPASIKERLINILESSDD